MSERQADLIHIRGRILELESELEAWKVRHNSLVLPGRLPADVLFQVFSYSASSCMKGSWEPQLAWIRVSHVCSHWRTVALECVALWSNVTFFHPEATDAMLQRSQSAPLSVTFTRGGSFTQHQALLKVLSQAHRIRCLEIQEDEKKQLQFNYFLAKLSKAKAPILENISMTKVTDQYEYEIPAFADGGMPSLRSLVLTRFLIPSWSALPLGARMTTLALHQSPSSRGIARPSAASFFGALEKMPLLRDLTLTSLLPVKGRGYRELATPIQLNALCPALQRLVLCDSTRALRNLAKSVRFPKRLQLRIAFKNALTDDALSTCLVHLRDSWGEVLQDGVQAMTINESHIHWHPFLGCGRQFYFSFKHTKLGGDLSVTFKDPELSTDDIVLAFAGTLNVKSLQAIYIRGPTSMSASVWTTVFGGLTTLRKVDLWCSAVSSFVKALHHTTARRVGGGSSDSTPTGLGFPVLRKLNFWESIWPSGGLSCRLLRSAVESWPASRPPVKLKVFMCMNICEEDVKVLQDLSPKLQVEWDDHVYYPSEDETVEQESEESEDEDDWEDSEDDGDSSD